MNDLRKRIELLKRVNQRKLKGETTVKEIPSYVKSHLQGEISAYNKVLAILIEEEKIWEKL